MVVILAVILMLIFLWLWVAFISSAGKSSGGGQSGSRGTAGMRRREREAETDFYYGNFLAAQAAHDKDGQEFFYYAAMDSESREHEMGDDPSDDDYEAYDEQGDDLEGGEY